MLSINSIKKGIVLDHIKPSLGMEIYRILKLDKADYTVALIMNAQSRKLGRKDMIKIENTIDLDLAVLGYLDPNITVNIIEDEKIIEKVELSLPKEVMGVIECKNPRCITSIEREIVHKFVLVDEKEKKYKCCYCDHMYSED
ncbi:MAG: aspartate carbamoyltransferase regulatory subunit [Tissierellia bacterium]|nr:aspartate carbamoyltransferase regulatory subunit [Tissierellia bacterium]